MKRGKGRPVLLVVLLLVNAAAVWGQAGWALEHIVPAEWEKLEHGSIMALALSLGFALAIEMIGVFLALSADHAEDRDIPAGGIRLGSYAIGLVSGALNASHWGWGTAAAIAFALLSTISPFLWGIHSRVNRERTIAPSRRFWHPRRSIALIRHMAWEGIATEADGIASMKGMTPAERVYPVAELAEPIAEVQREVLASLPISPAELEVAAPVSPAAPQPPRPRTPRGQVAPELEKAVRLLLDGATVMQAVETSGAKRSTVGRYGTLRTALENSREPLTAPLPESLAGKVNDGMVSIMRDHYNRARAL